MFVWWPASGFRCALVAALLLALCASGAAEAAARQAADTDLLARLYTASDARVGSFLRAHADQRALFGLPLEPLSLSQNGVVSFANLEGRLLDEILWSPHSVIAGELFSAEAGPIKWAIGLGGVQREFFENPYDGSAQAQLLSALIEAGPLLTPWARGTVALQLLAGTVDRGVVVGETVRARVMQDRALAQARMPLGLQPRVDVAQQRIGTRSGAFQLAGGGFQAQGGWTLEHKDGIRSSAFARLDFQNQFLPNGALVSTLGEPPPSLSLADAPPAGGAAHPSDFVLNSLGRALGLNWVGRNVGGGDRDNYELDEWGQFQLGDTRVPGKTLTDAYARLHDIEYYVSTHFPEGTEVRVPSPDGDDEYFVSEGDHGPANLRVAARVIGILDPMSILHALGSRSYLGRRTPAGDPAAVVDVDDRSAMTVVDRERVLSLAPGGAFRSVQVTVGGNGVTVRRQSRVAYTHRYDGAAVSRAVEEYNRTGIYDPAKHYGLPSTDAPEASGLPPVTYPSLTDPKIEEPEPYVPNRRRDLPWSRPEWLYWDPRDPEPMGGGDDTPPPPPPPAAAERPGGVDLAPRSVVALGQQGLVDSIAALATAAVDGLGAERSVTQFDFGGERLVVARAGAGPSGLLDSTPAPEPEWSAPPVGRFSLAQTDLALEDDVGRVLLLRRFFDSHLGGGADAWSWLPFELELVPEPGSDTPAPAREVVLSDRQAGLQFGYELSAEAVPRYTALSPSESPRIAWDDVDDGYIIEFAHGFTVRFDPSGRLLWTGGDDPAERVRYRFAGRRLIEVARADLRIALSRDGAGTLRGARSSGGDEVRYGWNARGHLERVVGPAGAVRLLYDDAGLVKTLISNADGAVLFDNEYDATGRMLTRHTPSGSWRFRYADLAGGGKRIDVDDDAGDRSTFYYDAQGRLVAYGSSDGGTVLLRYRERGRIVQLAEAWVLARGSEEEPARFRVGDLIVPLRPATLPN